MGVVKSATTPQVASTTPARSRRPPAHDVLAPRSSTDEGTPRVLDGSSPTAEDASHGWEQYRFLALKLSRLAARVEELAVAHIALAPTAAGAAAFRSKAAAGGRR